MTQQTVTITEVKTQLEEARVELDSFLEKLEKHLRTISQAHTADRERLVCEATRMSLVYGIYLHSLTLVVSLNEGSRPSEAWDTETAQKALILFRRAKAAIRDEDRRKRVASRTKDLEANIGNWCPGFVVPTDSQTDPS